MHRHLALVVTAEWHIDMRGGRLQHIVTDGRHDSYDSHQLGGLVALDQAH